MHNAGSRRFLVNSIHAQLLNISRSQFTKQANSYQTRLQPLTLCGRLAAFTKHCVAQVAYKRSRCHFLTVCLSTCVCVCVCVCLCVGLTDSTYEIQTSGASLRAPSTSLPRTLRPSHTEHR